MTTQLGRFQLTTISGGTFSSDGGAMFGVVPRTLWSRKVQPDEKHRIPQRTNCLLIQSDTETILIDTGYGSIVSDKQRKYLDSEPGNPLLESLREVGVTPDQIDTVLLTHLHYDHAGGCVHGSAESGFAAVFPGARHLVQRGEWALAMAGFPELHAAYTPQHLRPLEEVDLQLLDGDTDVCDGIRTVVTPGHTPWHQSVIIESADSGAVYLGDLCPSPHHLKTGWEMAYDIDLLEQRRQKRTMLRQIAERNWWALFDHDADVAAARLAPDSRSEWAAVDAVAEL